MTSDEAAEERLWEWREGMHLALMFLRQTQLPGDFPFDFSPDSLAWLESILVEGTMAGEEDVFTEQSMGYLGEALMRVGGGSWKWDVEEDMPLVLFDEALGLEPLSPPRLVVSALESGSGTVFARAWHAVSDAVARRKQGDPSWAPVKERTPSVDPDDISNRQQDPWLVDWLAQREAAFPAWVANYGGKDPAVWDFSTESLDALEALVCQRLPTLEQFQSLKQGDFVQTAAWYLGEIAVRHRDAFWEYYHLDPDADPEDDWLHSSANHMAGRPFVTQRDSDGNTAFPVSELRVAVRTGEPGTLRERFKSWVRNPCLM